MKRDWSVAQTTLQCPFFVAPSRISLPTDTSALMWRYTVGRERPVFSVMISRFAFLLLAITSRIFVSISFPLSFLLSFLLSFEASNVISVPFKVSFSFETLFPLSLGSTTPYWSKSNSLRKRLILKSDSKSMISGSFNPYCLDSRIILGIPVPQFSMRCM